MKTARRSVLVSLTACALWGAACSSAQLVPNPLVSGQVAANRQTATAWSEESKYGLTQGTLASEGTLLSMSEQEVCFQVTLRTVGQRNDLAAPQGWRVFLRGKPDFEDMAPQIKETYQIQQQDQPGMLHQEISEQQQVCDAYGNNCVTQTIKRNITVPTVVAVLTGGGVVCFQNHGNLSKTTREITLHLDDPRTFWPAQRRIEFGYRFQ